MCIILYHQKGKKLPSRETLEECFRCNKDGVGFMWRRGDKLRVRKGFMSFQAFWAAYRNEVPKEEDEFAIHFRWATAGGVSSGNCHPFPIAQEEAQLRKLKWYGEQALMHNGVLGKGKGSLSDTMLFIKNELFYLRDTLEDKEVQEHIVTTTKGSKLLFFFGGGFKRTGDWVEDSDTGILYSNRGYVIPYATTDWSAWRKEWAEEWAERRKAEEGKRLNYSTRGIVTLRTKCDNCKIKGIQWFSASRFFDEITCLKCGYIFNTAGDYIDFKTSIRTKYLASLEESGDQNVKEGDFFCSDCGAGEDDVCESYDSKTLQSCYYCVTCEKWVGVVWRFATITPEEEESACMKVLKCTGCGLDADEYCSTFYNPDTKETRWYCSCCEKNVEVVDQEGEVYGVVDEDHQKCEGCGAAVGDDFVVYDETVDFYFCVACGVYLV